MYNSFLFYDTTFHASDGGEELANFSKKQTQNDPFLDT
jgi:hypothetical protein